MSNSQQKQSVRKPAWAERMAAARIMRDYSQAEFANSIGISASRYGNYEQGTREPDFATLIKICTGLGISIDFLVAGRALRSAHPELDAPIKRKA